MAAWLMLAAPVEAEPNETLFDDVLLWINR